MMKKLMIALAASLGLGAAATVPAQADSSWSVSAGFYTAPTYYAPLPVYKAPTYRYVAPTYYAPAPLYRAPAVTYFPRYYNPAPAISFSFGKTFGTRSYGHKHYNRPAHYGGNKHYNRPAHYSGKKRINHLERKIDRLETSLEKQKDRNARLSQRKHKNGLARHNVRVKHGH